MAILYEIYKTSLRRVSYEMTMSIRFCLSYDSVIRDFIAFKLNFISIRKHIVERDVVSDVTCTRQSVITRSVMRFL